MSIPILVLNCGSSSVKYQMIDVESEEVLASGLVEKIGLADGNLTHKTGGDEHRIDQTITDHTAALQLVSQAFDTWGPALHSVVAVGHRTVHGGDTFRDTTLITDAVIDGLIRLSPLAPLHNPPAIAGIRAAQSMLPDVPHVAVFDTAFFSTLPAEAYTYAINREVAEKYGIRKYGFHGTSHSFVSKAAAAFMGADLAEVNQIVCHLGNGASISAVAGGIAIEASMGLTPLAGLVMGTRSGDVDPGVFAYLEREAGMTSQQIDDLLNKKSGMAGLADGSSDFRDLWAKMDAGDEHAQLAHDVYVHRLISYIGAYMAILGRTEYLVFTAGVGENANRTRAIVIDRLAGFGIRLDAEANNSRIKSPTIISTPDSAVTVLVVPTNEELAMARETYRVTR
ncbi:MAG: acetate kinase [Propionibacteriaceae bacterium]|nr:acetate kinase [Propionibacteriaceae bacterium]